MSEIIREKKVRLITWLCGEDMFLQHVHAENLITGIEYSKLKSIQDPTNRVTDLLDIIDRKGNSVCIKFLELLKKDDVNESRPELREWIRTLDISASAPREESVTSQAAHVTITDNLGFLKKNRSTLIEKVKNVESIVDNLDLKGEMTANIQAQPTDYQKMRKLLDYTNTKKAAQRLVDALSKHDPDLMEELTEA